MWAEYFIELRQAVIDCLNFEILGFPFYDYLISIGLGMFFGCVIKTFKKVLDNELF